MSDWTCSYKDSIYGQPIVPRTEEAARVQGVTVERLLEERIPLVDTNICFITGRICPGRIDECDARITLRQVEQEFKAFMRDNLLDRPNLAEVMLRYFCVSSKPMVKALDPQYLLMLVGTQEIVGLQQILVAELSLRRGEISDWVLTPQRDFSINLEQYPVNHPRAVTLQIVEPIFGDGVHGVGIASSMEERGT